MSDVSTRHSEDGTAEVAALQADIERTREDLAQTVDLLAAKMNVKTRVRNRVTESKDQALSQMRDLRDRATDESGRPVPATIAVGSIVAAALVTVVLATVWKRKR